MTAVEFLVNQLEQNKFITESQIHIAKEMEKQQGYSEEEVIAFGEFIFKHTLLTHSKGVKNLFKQFKNK
jgi:hypothetical protein